MAYDEDLADRVRAVLPPAEAVTRHLFVVNPGGFSAVQEFLAGFWAEHLGPAPGDAAGSR